MEKLELFKDRITLGNGSEIFKEMILHDILKTTTVGGGENITLRCKEIPGWPGCLTELSVEGPLVIHPNGSTKGIMPGDFITVVATGGIARVVHVLNYKPKKWRRRQ